MRKPSEGRCEMTETLAPYMIGELHYQARDIGYGVEEDVVVGYFTGAVDSWGKHTFLVIGGVPLYLFADEMVEWTPATEWGGERR
jgi:hypothetical protein